MSAIEVLKERYPGAVTFKFGDSATLSAAHVSRVRSGRKVATCGALRDFENGEPLPSVGRRDIVLAWDGSPELVIETVEVVQCSFEEVTEAMALAEGENNDLEGWRNDHRAFFKRTGGFSPEMQVVWERFALIEDLSQKG
ncbi:ASCH domain-containing protein [Loktanella sp. R86503]|uniref:ASCH domain-containing protein n=1 Tax=Loktanella sp. R86503 TaxID=3093847 RepID=UPI0036DCB0FD